MALESSRALEHGGDTEQVGSGNRATFFDDGEALFEATVAAIRSAERRVWIETFLFTPDVTGRRILEHLAAAARRGCDVILLFDQLGSHVTSLGAFAPVEQAGGRVAIFNPLPPWRRYGRRFGSWLRYRSHRKTVVIDDVGFIGGHNFSRSYMGRPPHHFYDMTVRLEGPCVADLAAAFLEVFESVTGERRPRPNPAPQSERGVRVEVHALDLRRGRDDLLRAYTAALDGARREALLVLGYFVPDAPLRAPLLRAAQRGVRVRVLTAGASDFPVIRWAGQHTYDRLLEAGLQIWQLQEPNLHAKAIVVDGERCLVGSFDVNTYERRNYAEVAATLHDPALALRIEEAYQSCLERSQRIEPESWRKRSIAKRSLDWLSYRVLRV